MHFGKKGKLAPQFIKRFEVLERVGAVAYHLALPPHLSTIHNVFHVTMRRKYQRDASHVIKWKSFDLQSDTSYVEQPIRIIDRKEHVLQSKVIPLAKVQWKHHSD